LFKFAPYVLKTLWRHRARTALTVTGAGVALAVFCFVGAIQEGLARLTSGQAAERSLVVFQANRFCPATSRLPEDYVQSIAKVQGVRDVVPIKVFMNNCRASLDAVVFHGVPPQKLRASRGLTLLEGDWGGFETKQDAAIVGRVLARRRRLSAGQKFSIGPLTVTVAGIYGASSPTEESYIYCHLDFLQRIPGLNSVGSVTQFEIQLAEGANADATCRTIDSLFASGPIQTDTRPKGVFETNAVGDLVELIRFSHFLGFACIGLVLALVATTTVMAVEDRVREHAVLQTLGFSPRRVFWLVLAECLLVSLAGGFLGVGMAQAILASGRLSVTAEGVTIGFTPSMGLAVAAIAVALCVGLLAGLTPAWRAAQADIVRSLRQV
jgi:putative ABC transport system permease protein